MDSQRKKGCKNISETYSYLYSSAERWEWSKSLQNVFCNFYCIKGSKHNMSVCYIVLYLFLYFQSFSTWRETKRYHLVWTPVFWVSCYYSFYCMNIKIKGRGRSWSCTEARARLGNCCWWRFTKSFQSASILSYFPVSEKWGGGGGNKKGKKPFLLPGYKRLLYVVFKPPIKSISFFVPLLNGYCFLSVSCTL